VRKKICRIYTSNKSRYCKLQARTTHITNCQLAPSHHSPHIQSKMKPLVKRDWSLSSHITCWVTRSYPQLP